MHALIEPAFLPSISWSGRGRGKEMKIPLSKFSNTVNLIALALEKADKKFDQLETIKCLKYKVIKYAPAKYGSKETCASKDDDNISTVSETVSSCSQNSIDSILISSEHTSSITGPPSRNISPTTQYLNHNPNLLVSCQVPNNNIPTPAQYLNQNRNQNQNPVFGLQTVPSQQVHWPYQNYYDYQNNYLQHH